MGLLLLLLMRQMRGHFVHFVGGGDRRAGCVVGVRIGNVAAIRAGLVDGLRCRIVGGRRIR